MVPNDHVKVSYPVIEQHKYIHMQMYMHKDCN
jgi:hypothetical protein